LKKTKLSSLSCLSGALMNNGRRSISVLFITSSDYIYGYHGTNSEYLSICVGSQSILHMFVWNPALMSGILFLIKVNILHRKHPVPLILTSFSLLNLANFLMLLRSLEGSMLHDVISKYFRFLKASGMMAFDLFQCMLIFSMALRW